MNLSKSKISSNYLNLNSNSNLDFNFHQINSKTYSEIRDKGNQPLNQFSEVKQREEAFESLNVLGISENKQMKGSSESTEQYCDPKIPVNGKKKGMK